MILELNLTKTLILFQHIKYISEIIDDVTKNPKKKCKLLDFNNPDKYIGAHIGCKKGYSTNEDIRGNAASGGMVTALLCNMLKNKEIDGAWVTKTAFENGQLTYKTYLQLQKKKSEMLHQVFI